jgi:hypothetical protein
MIIQLLTFTQQYQIKEQQKLQLIALQHKKNIIHIQTKRKDTIINNPNNPLVQPILRMLRKIHINIGF